MATRTAWQYHFRAQQWRACPLRTQDVTAQNKSGRSVSQNDYQAQNQAARQRATTDDYQ